MKINNIFLDPPLDAIDLDFAPEEIRKNEDLQEEIMKNTNFSELESLSSLTDYQLRKLLQELVSYKQQIDSQLQDENLEEKRRIDLQAAREMAENNIQQIRFSGIF